MLARNDYIYSVLNGDRNPHRNVLQRIDVKKKSARHRNSYGAGITKNAIGADEMRKTINKARKTRNALNTAEANAVPLSKRQKKPAMNTVGGRAGYRKSDVPSEQDGIQLNELPPTEVNSSVKEVNISDSLPSEAKVMSRRINQKVKSVDTQSSGGTNRIKRKNLLRSAVAVA